MISHCLRKVLNTIADNLALYLIGPVMKSSSHVVCGGIAFILPVVFLWTSGGIAEAREDKE
jgi:hypothetical protein